MGQFLEACRAYGADVAGAMNRFLEDEVLYHTCVESFAEDENFEALPKLLAAQEYAAAFDCAHTLKGVAANLGLSPLLDAIVGIVEPLRSKDYSNQESQCAAVLQEQKTLQAMLLTAQD